MFILFCPRNKLIEMDTLPFKLPLQIYNTHTHCKQSFNFKFYFVFLLCFRFYLNYLHSRAHTQHTHDPHSLTSPPPIPKMKWTNFLSKIRRKPFYLGFSCGTLFRWLLCIHFRKVFLRILFVLDLLDVKPPLEFTFRCCCFL